MAGAATVEKALDVLFHLHAAPVALGLSEIGRALDLPKSSCHRLLSSLLDREVVEQDDRGRYRPGLALLSLGLGAQAREPVVRAARPSLEAEAAALGETVFLVARRRTALRVIDKCEGTGFLRASPEIGDEIPTDVTAAGHLERVFAGLRREASRDAAPGVESGSLSEQDAEVIARGYAVNRDAWIEGLSVLAVPIFEGPMSRAMPGGAGPAPTFVASLALGAASGRFDSLGETRVAEQLLAAAQTIGARLGGHPSAPSSLKAET